MNVFKLFNSVVDASEQGKQLSDPSLWADRASLTATLLAVLNSLTPVLEHLQLNIDYLQDIVGTVSIVGVLVIDRIHVASNKDAGVKR